MAFNKYVLLRSKLKSGLAIVTVFNLLWLIVLNYNKPFDPLIVMIELIIFYLAWGVLILIMYMISFYRIRKMPDQDGSILRERTYVILDEGIKEVTTSSETLFRWNGIKKVAETNDYVYLFTDRIAAFIIPKRYLKGPGESERFVELLKQKISG